MRRTFAEADTFHRDGAPVAVLFSLTFIRAVSYSHPASLSASRLTWRFGATFSARRLVRERRVGASR